jgi:DNA helicase-2/ATP-dependent DNA helicase PcrA
VEGLLHHGDSLGRTQAPPSCEGLISRAPDVLGGESLDAEQRAVVEAPPGPTVVLAGAGSGKTRVLVHRVARLIAAGVAPEAIVLCTFTQRAARELGDRVRALVGAAAERVRAGTIHHLAHRVLEEHGPLGRYRILDRADADQLLDEALTREEPESQGGTRADDGLPRVELVRSLYSRALAEQRTLAEVVARQAPRFSPKVAALEARLDQYARDKAAARALDFDDLLFFCKMLLTEQRPRLGIEHVLVDEFQDVSRLQAELLGLLGGHLMVVGDPAQAIYSFRGADPRHLSDFAALHPSAQVLSLRVNYRSSKAIVAVSNRVCGRQLEAVRETSPDERQPARVEVDDDRQQALFVAARMAERIAAGVRPGELAALYRTHAHGLELELELARRKLPYRLRSGRRFAEQPHIKDALAWLRLSVDGHDALAWSRVARQLPGVGARSAARIAEAGRLLGLDAAGDRALAAGLPSPARSSLGTLRALTPLLRQGRPEELLAALGERLSTGDEAAEEDLRALARLAAASASTAQLLEALVLHGEDQPGRDAVTLSTVHQAKGLEWQVVFVLSLVEGRFPLPAREPGDLDEERRLFYVAVTRARDELYLLRPSRDARGPLTPSRHLLELDGLVERWSVVS